MLKKLFKQVICSLLFYSWLLNFYLLIRRHFADFQPTVLMYHRVLKLSRAEGYDFSHRGMVVSQQTFEKQVAFLKKYYALISLDEFIATDNYPRNACIVTFDDGWQDNYVYALPVLRAYHCPATIFLVPSLVGTNSVFWQEKLVYDLLFLKSKDLLEDWIRISGCPEQAHKQLLVISGENPNCGSAGFDALIDKLMSIDDRHRDKMLVNLSKFLSRKNLKAEKRKWILSWSEIRQMQKDGISFGSHSKTHKILTRIEEKEALAEISDSKSIIEDNLEAPVKAFAYPNGDWNKSTESLVNSSGYKCALSTEKGSFSRDNGFVTIRRIGIHEAMSTDFRGRFSKCLFACEVAGIFDDIRRLTGKLPPV